MSAIRFFTDEDVYGATVLALRRAGFDSVSTPESGQMRQSDESQLIWSAGQRRAIVTFNVSHFAALHASWIGSGQSHSGIVDSSQRPLGDLIRRLLHLANTLEAEAMRDRIEYLSDW